MSARRRLPRVVLALVVGALLAPAVAPAAPYDDVFADYTADGRIDACAHTPEELRAAQSETPDDIAAFAPDFPAALTRAIGARGACGEAADGEAAPAPSAPGGAAPGAPPTPPGQTPNPGATASPAPRAADGAIADAARAGAQEAEPGTPAALVLLAVLAALLALAVLLAVIARALSREPRWVLASRHAMAEAGWRMGAAAGDFRDWLRTRRTPSSQ